MGTATFPTAPIGVTWACPCCGTPSPIRKGLSSLMGGGGQTHPFSVFLSPRVLYLPAGTYSFPGPQSPPFWLSESTNPYSLPGRCKAHNPFCTHRAHTGQNGYKIYINGSVYLHFLHLGTEQIFFLPRYRARYSSGCGVGCRHDFGRASGSPGGPVPHPPPRWVSESAARKGPFTSH